MTPDKPKVEVTEYRMSIHFGVCLGPVDQINAIYVGEKEAWSGQFETQTTFEIDKRDLFGGIKKEGGVSGQVTYLPGASDQLMSAHLAEKFALTPDLMPAYRGRTTLFFSEPEGESRKGFYWSANSPYLKGVWVKAARASTSLTVDYSRLYYQNLNDAFKRNISNISGDRSLIDIRAGRIVHFNSGKTQLIAEEARTGTVKFSEPITYSPLWLTIVEETRDILVLEANESILHIYNWDTGDEKQVLTGLSSIGFPTLSGRPSNVVALGLDHYVFWKVYTSMQAIFHDGLTDEWEHAWTDNLGLGALWSYGGLVAASPQYLAHKTAGDSSSPYRISWDETGIGTVHFADEHDATTGWNMISEGLNSITWMPEQEAFAFAGSGQYMTLSEDLATVINYNGATGFSSGTHQYPMSSRRAQFGQRSVVYADQHSSPEWGHIYVVNTDTGAISFSEPLSEFGFTSSVFAASYLEAGYDSASATILLQNGPSAWALVFPFGPFDANPSHMIYDCLTNTSWGAGFATAAIDTGSFLDAAVTLYGEAFGLSMIWTQQTTVEAFVKEIQDHIEAAIFTHPRTGLMTIKLIRGDYDPDALPILTTLNSKITNFKRKLYGETINEIVVTWTDPANEEEKTVTVQNDANIAIQGALISEGRNYYGIRNVDLATTVAYRDLRSASYPLATCDVEVDRTAWDFTPGDVVKITSPEDGITEMIMRIGPIDYGRVGQPMIKMALTEDVFALEMAEFDTPADSAWEDDSAEPSPADFTYIFTLPYYLTLRDVDPTLTLAAEYPTVFAGVLAADDGGAYEFELWGEQVSAAGSNFNDALGTKSIASHAELLVALPMEAASSIASFGSVTDGEGPEAGGLLIIGDGDETQVELALITAATGLAVTVDRGVLDTTPKSWPVGTPIWFLGTDLIYADDHARSAAELVEYKVLPRTSLGILPVGDVGPVSATLTERPWLPSRPANVTIAGVDFTDGVIDALAIDPIPVTWVERNRLTEDSVILSWTDATVTPEDGQTTRITVMDAARNVLTVHDGLTGLSFDVPVASFLANTIGIIRVESVRDDLVSLQGHELAVMVPPDGYGYGYGYNYGGA